MVCWVRFCEKQILFFISLIAVFWGFGCDDDSSGAASCIGEPGVDMEVAMKWSYRKGEDVSHPKGNNISYIEWIVYRGGSYRLDVSGIGRYIDPHESYPIEGSLQGEWEPFIVGLNEALEGIGCTDSGCHETQNSCGCYEGELMISWVDSTRQYQYNCSFDDPLTYLFDYLNSLNLLPCSGFCESVPYNESMPVLTWEHESPPSQDYWLGVDDFKLEIMADGAYTFMPEPEFSNNYSKSGQLEVDEVQNLLLKAQLSVPSFSITNCNSDDYARGYLEFLVGEYLLRYTYTCYQDYLESLAAAVRQNDIYQCDDSNVADDGRVLAIDFEEYGSAGPFLDAPPQFKLTLYRDGSYDLSVPRYNSGWYEEDVYHRAIRYESMVEMLDELKAGLEAVPWPCYQSGCCNTCDCSCFEYQLYVSWPTQGKGRTYQIDCDNNAAINTLFERCIELGMFELPETDGDEEL